MKKLLCLLLFVSAAVPAVFSENLSIISVSSVSDPSRAKIRFSSMIDPGSASFSPNYTVNREIGVNSAELQPDGKTVVLSLSPSLAANILYILTVRNIRDSSGNPTPDASVFFDFIDVPQENLALWLRADRFLNLDEDCAVLSWNDSSGNANNALPFSEKKVSPPFWTDYVLNGRPVVVFPRKSAGFSASKIPALDSDEISWFAVFKTDDIEKKQYILSSFHLKNKKKDDDKDKNKSEELWGAYIRDYELVSFASSDKGKEIRTKHPLDENWHFLSSVWDSNDALTSFLDGGSGESAGGVDASPAGHKELFIGTRDGEHPLEGGLAEIIVYSGGLSEDERLKVETYLAAKYFTIDADADGLTDAWEMKNFGDLSQDADGDYDNDGLTNLQEFNAGTSPVNSDSDNDGMPDGWEVSRGLNPLADDANSDPDADALTNILEYTKGTDPKNPDTDSDGIKDGAEVANSFSPTNIDDPGLLKIIVNLSENEVIR